MVRRNRTIRVKIPAGIDEGQTISMRGEGSSGINGGEAGDLYVTVSIRPHESFRREGTSVRQNIKISFVQAALGADIEVSTLDGKVRHTIPSGTQTGTTFRLKGKGIPNLRGNGRGDHFVTVTLEVPTSLSSEQKELLAKFAEAGGDTTVSKKRRK